MVVTIVTTKQLETLNRRVDRHEGCNAEWLGRHERACREAVKHGRPGVLLLARSLVDRAAHTNNLLLAWDHVRVRSGTTAGPDGLACDALGPRSEVCAFMRSLGRAMKDGSYRHGPTKAYRLAKRGGGFRRIHVQNLEDRVVHRAIVQVVQPLVDRVFVPSSFGYRPGRSRFQPLALLGQYVADGSAVLVVEDLKGAFDHVPVNRLLAVLKRCLPCDRLLQLVRRAIRAGGRAKGLPQGAALSPLLLNLYLHHVLDRPWRPPVAGRLPLLRYADNIVVPCATAAEAAVARAELDRLLGPAGFRLKPAPDGGTTVRDLGRGMSANVLGFDVTLAAAAGRVEYRIPRPAWDALADRLDGLAGGPTPAGTEAHAAAAAAWLRAMGPSYVDVRRDEVFATLFDLGDGAGVDLRGYREALQAAWRKAWRQWDGIRRDARDAHAAGEVWP